VRRTFPEPTFSARGPGHYGLLALAALGPLALAVIGLLTRPDARGYGTHEQLGLPACRSIDWLGIPCPACGVTTSVALALRGELLQSLVNQPAGLALTLLLPLLFAGALWVHARGGDLRAVVLAPGRERLVAAAAVALVLAWAWKIWLVRSGA
jgi:hypothetical protein